ncbi:MAG: glycosyltransferase family 39 protein, partial [bacterium]|nr:glycosyltransferase family 39 protein [bacterium]
MTRQKISTLAWITGIFIASLCVRLLLVGQKFCIEASDSVDYLNMAKHWAEGGTLFETFYTPGYPIAIALCHVFTGQWESAGRLASALLGTAAVLPAMGIARRVFSRKTAVLSGLIFSVYPALTEASTHVLSESTYVFFVLLALWAGLVAWQSSHKVLFLLAGAVSGMAYLVKPEGVLLFATLCGAGLIWTWKDRAWSTWV